MGPRTPRTIVGPLRRLGPLGLGPTGPNPRGLEPAWVRLDASAPWVWALRAQTQGASNQRGSASTPRPLGFGPYGPKPKGPRTSVGPPRRLGPLGLGPTGPNPRGLEPAWVRLDASAPWVWALWAQTQGASNQCGSASTPRPLGFRPYGPKPKGPRTLRARLHLT